MILKLFAVYDNKIASFGTPFFQPLTEFAKRAMARAVSDESLDYGRFSEDFALFELGEFNCETAEFNLMVSPKNLGPLTLFKELGK